MIYDISDKARQRRALGKLLMGVGEILTDDDKRAQVEARIQELKAQVGNDPWKALELARMIAEALNR